MAKRRKVRVSTRKTVYTFVRLRSISVELLGRANSGEHGQSLMLSASMVFSAFTFEAFLNHVGASQTNFWTSVERLAPLTKLELISTIKSFNVDLKKRPFQTIKRMFRFRDALAHGKTQEIYKESIQFLKEDERPQPPMTDWEKEITLGNAKLYLDDTRAAMTMICDKCGIEPMDMFVSMEHQMVASPIIDEK